MHLQRQSILKSEVKGNDIDKEFRNIFKYLNSMQGSSSVEFKNGKIDTKEPLHSQGVPNFKGLKLGKVKKNDFDLSVQDTFTFANEGYIKGYDGRGFFLGFDDFDNYISTLFEIDNVVIRGSLFARQFVIDTWKYRAGNEIQGAGGGLVKNTGTTPSTWFELEDMSGNAGVYCNVNDVVMCQETDRKGVTFDVNGDVVDGTYLLKRLIYKVSSISGNKCYLTSVTGAPGNKATISKGDEFVVLYNTTDTSRQSIIGYMNNVKYAPYIFMKTGINSWPTWQATNNCNLVLGNMAWFTDADFGTLTGFGLYATNVYLKGHLSLADNGWINLGKTAYTDTTHGGFWMGDKDATAVINPYFYIGAASDTKYIKIDTTAGTFDTLGFEIAAGAVKSTATMTYTRGIAGTEFGYWLGRYGAGDYRLYIGSSAAKYFKYDNTDFTLLGGRVFAGSIASSNTMSMARGLAGTEAGYWLGQYNPADFRLFIGSSASKYFSYNNADIYLVGGEVISGIVRSSGTKDYGDNEAGYWLGKYGTNDYRFEIYNSASKYFTYNNSDFTLVGGTITGGTIQTATTGQRIIMDGSTNNLKFFDASNNNIVRIGGNVSGTIPGINIEQGCQFIYHTISGAYGVNVQVTGSLSTAFIAQASGSSTTVGVNSYASGSGTNYAIYAGASGGTSNWAGYFYDGSVGIGGAKFIINNSGQITKINNVVTAGYIPISNGTHYEPRILAASDIPNLAASIITSGTFDAARMPSAVTWSGAQHMDNNLELGAAVSTTSAGNLSIAGKNYLRITTTSGTLAITLTGMVGGQLVYISNLGGSFSTTVAGVTIPAGKSALVLYDGVSAAWRNVLSS